MLIAVIRNRDRQIATRLMYGYGVISVVQVVIYPFLNDAARVVDFLAVCALALVGVVVGRQTATPGMRQPWTLLLTGLGIIAVANAARIVAGDWVAVPRLLLDAVGNIFLLAAALTFIIRRGFSDLGGIIDTTIIALAFGGLLWGVALPHRLGLDASVAAQVNLFIVVYALTGVLGALLRLSRTLPEPRQPLRWLMAGIALGIGANVALAFAGDDPVLLALAEMLFMAAFAAAGLFGLDPDGPALFRTTGWTATEELSPARLAFLGVAAALMPVVLGVREALGGSGGGLLLAIQGALVAALVMVRIGLLSAQRAEAEQALRHQATHDPLTHVLNRHEFVARLREELAQGTRCAVLFCDLDDFKSINDRFGHDTGDRLLIEVAHRLQTGIAAPHLVSRFGGDEFVVLLVDEEAVQAEAARSQLLNAFAEPSDYTGGAPIRVSIGLAVADESWDAEDLIRAADRSMYRVKAAR